MPDRSNRPKGIHVVRRKGPRDPVERLKQLTFKTGEAVPESGVYGVVHSDHRLPHEVTLLRGSAFPPCSKCVDDVRFQLLRAVNVGTFQIVLNQLPEMPDDMAGAEDAKKTG